MLLTDNKTIRIKRCNNFAGGKGHPPYDTEKNSSLISDGNVILVSFPNVFKCLDIRKAKGCTGRSWMFHEDIYGSTKGFNFPSGQLVFNNRFMDYKVYTQLPLLIQRQHCHRPLNIKGKKRPRKRKNYILLRHVWNRLNTMQIKSRILKQR